MNIFQDADVPGKIKMEVKSTSSSLRSVRVKSDRIREQSWKDKISTVKEENAKINGVKNEEELTVTKEELGPIKSVHLKENEPILTAATPTQKLIQDISPSPIEGKESILSYNSEIKNQEVGVVEVPYKPSTPEIIDLESDTYKSITSQTNYKEVSTVEDKRQKLDILKQGGLEVTAVQPTVPEITRPSVIQQALTLPSRIGFNNKSQMPPPTNSTFLKKPTQNHSIHSTVLISTPKYDPHKKHMYLNGNVPPKVLQSKSIYTPSENTVYGDPKDIFRCPVINIPTPKFVENRVVGGGILDLTVKSPHKPFVDLLQIPTPAHQPLNLKDNKQNLTYKPQVLDGRRMSSNLEITLVESNNNNNNYNNKHQTFRHSFDKMESQMNKYISGNTKSTGHKRSFYSENHHGSKIPRVDDKIASPYTPQFYETQKLDFNGRYSNQRNSKKDIAKLTSPPNLKQSYNPSTLYNSAYVSHFPEKNVSYIPAMPPTNDHVYFRTLQYMMSMQNLYPNVPTVPPLISVPTPEQLQFYTDLMVHNTRLRFPLTFAQDETCMDNKKKWTYQSAIGI